MRRFTRRNRRRSRAPDEIPSMSESGRKPPVLPARSDGVLYAKLLKNRFQILAPLWDSFPFFPFTFSPELDQAAGWLSANEAKQP